VSRCSSEGGWSVANGEQVAEMLHDVCGYFWAMYLLRPDGEFSVIIDLI
jgi:hypothetical protein